MGVVPRDGASAARPEPDTPFRVEARPLGLPEGVNLDDIGDLLERLDGLDFGSFDGLSWEDPLRG